MANCPVPAPVLPAPDPGGEPLAVPADVAHIKVGRPVGRFAETPSPPAWLFIQGGRPRTVLS